MKESPLPAHHSESLADRRNRQKLCLTLGALMLLFSFASVAMAAEKSVLFIHTSKSNGPGTLIYDKAFQTALNENTSEPITLSNEYTDLWSHTDEGYAQTLNDFYRQKYSGQHFDLIVVESLPALRFLLAYGDELFPGTPVVFCLMERSLMEGLTLKPNFTGVLAGFDFRRSLESALRLQPDTRHVVVVSGGSPLDQKYLAMAQKEFQPFAAQVEFDYLADLPLEEIEKRVSTLAEDSIVFYVTLYRDGTGRAIPPAEAAARVGLAANAPFYSFAEFLVTPAGGVGGYLWSMDADTSELSKTVRRVLAGTKPQDIPIYVGDTNRYIFDWRQLRRWGIDESKLPAGSIVRNREISVWELYKWRIIGSIALIILQTLLIIALLLNRAKRRKAEEASKLNETRYRNVVETQTELICRYQPDTTLTFVNDAYCRYFGKSSEQLIGTKFSELLPEHARDAALAHIASIIENPRSENYEHEVVLPNGETGWQEWVDHVSQSTNGGGIELQGIGRDITERRQAEEELRLSEMRFRHMADTSEIFIWIADVNMLCTYFNRRVLDFTGRTMDQLLGEGWLGIIHQDDVQRCVETYTAGYEKREPFVLEFRIRRADGEFRWIYDTGSPRLAADGELIGYIGSAVDITDRRAAEEALQIAHEEVSKLKNQLEAENIYLQEEIRLTHNVDEIVGESNAIKYVLFKIEQVAQTETSVLVLGETGTGKELVARAIHSQSSRKDRPLVKVNCAALSASLIESELFGHEKGSFTGASSRKIGRFELADGATIFLDEIGELPLELQPKLLRVIQEGEFERLGSAKTIKVDVRLIAATNRNLKNEVEKGTFREDLWYRLNVFPITLPPLRQRKEDIPLMVEHFARVFSKKVGKTITSVSSATMKKFQEHSWPGNVRELSNVVERALVTTQGTVLHVADQFEQQKDSPDLIKTLEEIEKEHITRILEQTAWRVEGPSGAARILGLNPSTLRTRMGKLGIQKNIRSFAQSSKQQN